MNFSVRPGSLSPVIGLIHGAPYGGPSPKYSSILGCLGSANKPMYNRTQGRSMKPWYPNFGGERCPLWVGSGHRLSTNTSGLRGIVSADVTVKQAIDKGAQRRQHVPAA